MYWPKRGQVVDEIDFPSRGSCSFPEAGWPETSGDEPRGSVPYPFAEAIVVA